jgi:hypothetical protein
VTPARGMGEDRAAVIETNAIATQMMLASIAR